MPSPDTYTGVQKGKFFPVHRNFSHAALPTTMADLLSLACERIRLPSQASLPHDWSERLHCAGAQRNSDTR